MHIMTTIVNLKLIVSVQISIVKIANTVNAKAYIIKQSLHVLFFRTYSLALSGSAVTITR